MTCTLDTLDDLLGHPVAGASWDGFVIETLLRAAPERMAARFYRTATGVELDLVLELPGNRLWDWLPCGAPPMDSRRSCGHGLKHDGCQTLTASVRVQIAIGGGETAGPDLDRHRQMEGSF